MEKALELVEQLAVKLGVAAEYLMAVLVKQQYAEGITNLIMAGVNLLIIIAMLVIIPKVTKKMNSEHEKLKTDRLENETGYGGSRYVSSTKEDFFAAMTYAIPLAAIVLGSLLLSCGIDEIKIGVQQLINPEYFAFKEILNVISAG